MILLFLSRLASELEKDPNAPESSGVTSKHNIDITTAAHGHIDELDFDKGAQTFVPMLRGLSNCLSFKDDAENLTRHAAVKAHEHVLSARERAKAFDVEANIERQKNEKLAKTKSGSLAKIAADLSKESAQLNCRSPVLTRSSQC